MGGRCQRRSTGIRVRVHAHTRDVATLSGRPWTPTQGLRTGDPAAVRRVGETSLMREAPVNSGYGKTFICQRERRAGARSFCLSVFLSVCLSVCLCLLLSVF